MDCKYGGSISHLYYYHVYEVYTTIDCINFKWDRAKAKAMYLLM